LIAASVTGRGSFLSATTSTTYSLPEGSYGSGYASPAARAVATTAFCLPVW
jgi:hypothetical protein